MRGSSSNVALSTSLPVRERGLKYVCYRLAMIACASLPVRERGLKYLLLLPTQYALQVAPRSGAWIEMNRSHQCGNLHTVAPRSGAWIEIRQCRTYGADSNVAPRSGAWIEIIL